MHEGASLSRLEILFNEKSPINQARQRPPEHRANPINGLIVPMAAGERRSKGSRRIHCRASEWTAKQNIESDGESNGQSTNSGRSNVHGCSIDNKHQKKRQNSLHHNPLHRSNSLWGQIRRAIGHNRFGENRSFLRINLAGENKQKHKTRRRSSSQLRDPEGNRLYHSQSAANEQSERHRRVKLAPRNPGCRRDHYSDRQPVSEGNSQQVAGIVINRSYPDENQGKGANKLSHALFE